MSLKEELEPCEAQRQQQVPRPGGGNWLCRLKNRNMPGVAEPKGAKVRWTSKLWQRVLTLFPTLKNPSGHLYRRVKLLESIFH